MGTPFSNIFDIFRTITADYRLDAILKTDEEVFYGILKQMLIVGLPEFGDCFKLLEYTIQEETKDDLEVVTRYYFVETLDNDEQMIIGKIMTEKWFLRKIQDLSALQDSLGKREFSKTSMSDELKQKSAYRKELISEYMADIKNYLYKHLDELEGWG